MSDALILCFAVLLWGSLGLFVIASATALPFMLFDEIRERRGREPALRPIALPIESRDAAYFAAVRQRMAALKLLSK